MKKTNKFILGVAAAAAVGFIVYALRSRRESAIRHARVSDEGYETAHDVLFPNKKAAAESFASDLFYQNRITGTIFVPDDIQRKVYDQYQQVLNDKARLLEQNLEGLFQSAQNETKRTAGDKHETALAMLQIEQENMRRQLQEARLQQSLFQKIDASLTSSRIISGSLVKTSNGYLFVSLALGKIVQDGITIMSVSPQSPLGSQLMGLTVTAEVVMNGRMYVIEEIS